MKTHYGLLDAIFTVLIGIGVILLVGANLVRCGERSVLKESKMYVDETSVYIEYDGQVYEHYVERL